MTTARHSAKVWNVTNPADPIVYVTAELKYRVPSGGSFCNETYLSVSWNTSPDPGTFGGPVAFDFGGTFDPETVAEGLSGTLEITTPWTWLASCGIWRAEGRYVVSDGEGGY